MAHAEYTRGELLLRLEQATADMSVFYKDDCINYIGQTPDTKEYYTEVIAQWLLKHLHLFDAIPRITRESSYWVKGHDGIPDNPNSNRREELIAMAMKRQGSLPLVGQVIDYQTPLKNVREDKAGKVDLLAYDGTTLRFLELKRPESEETMLRCVLEGYTYLKTANVEKLISNFGLPPDTVAVACPLVFYGGFQWDEMQQDRPHLKRLMDVLNCKAYYVEETDGIYSVKEG